MTRQSDRSGEASGRSLAHATEAGREALLTELRPVIDRLAARYCSDSIRQEVLSEQLNMRLRELLQESANGVPLRPFLVRTLKAFAESRSRNLANGRSVSQTPDPAESAGMRAHAELSELDIAALLAHGSEVAPLPEVISGLPAAQREVMALRYNGAHSVEEIAAHLGIPIAQVRTRLRQGLTTLRNRYWSLQN